MRRSNEPLWWLPFAAGMGIDAMVIPALVVITGIFIPLGLVNPEGLRGFLLHPLVRAGLFVVVSLSFFHAAHRLRFTLIDLGLKGADAALSVVCYGAAILGTLAAAAVALGLL
jgi:succinate dehydrogenase subunit D